MSLLRATTLACLFTVLISSCARAMSPQDQDLVERGMDALYKSDYDGAEHLFQEPMRERPDDPVLSLGYATATWWRMENDFALPGSADEQRFHAAIEKAIVDADRETRLGDSDVKAEAFLYLGAAYGLRARWLAAQKHWLAAYWDGRKAYKSARRALKLDPTLYDADLGIGAFDYYVATLGRVERVLAFTSGPGKEKGLAELQMAADYGRFSKVAAKLLLVGIDWTFEKKPQDAWKTLEELHERYPRSPMMDTMRLIGLYQLRDGPRLERDARLFLKDAEDGAPYFQPVDKTMGRYFVGLGEQLNGRYPDALADYQKALEDVPSPHRARSLLRLFIGESFDLLGRRGDALVSYKLALQEPPLWGVPRYAHFLLKHAFIAGDDPLPSRNAALQ